MFASFYIFQDTCLPASTFFRRHVYQLLHVSGDIFATFYMFQETRLPSSTCLGEMFTSFCMFQETWLPALTCFRRHVLPAQVCVSGGMFYQLFCVSGDMLYQLLRVSGGMLYQLLRVSGNMFTSSCVFQETCSRPPPTPPPSMLSLPSPAHSGSEYAINDVVEKLKVDQGKGSLLNIRTRNYWEEGGSSLCYCTQPHPFLYCWLPFNVHWWSLPWSSTLHLAMVW